MSVGKTTLVDSLRKLEQFKDYKFATERSKYLNDLGIPLNTDSTLKGQIVFLAERAAELMNKNIITDRTIIDVMSFSSVSSSMSFYDKEKFMDISSLLLDEYDYIFYIDPENIPIEDNGVRETNEVFRKDIDDIIKYNLKVYGHRINNLHVIKGSNSERIIQMLHFMQK